MAILRSAVQEPPLNCGAGAGAATAEPSTAAQATRVEPNILIDVVEIKESWQRCFYESVVGRDEDNFMVDRQEMALI